MFAQRVKAVQGHQNCLREHCLQMTWRYFDAVDFLLQFQRGRYHLELEKRSWLPLALLDKSWVGMLQATDDGGTYLPGCISNIGSYEWSLDSLILSESIDELLQVTCSS